MKRLKVPISAAWLQEEGLLESAAKALGYEVVLDTITREGAALAELPAKSRRLHIKWADNLLFTLSQLHEVGFDSGELRLAKKHKIFPEISATIDSAKDTNRVERRQRLAEKED